MVRTHTGCRRSVVAASTGAGRIGMIEIGRQPAGCGMAKEAVFRKSDVICVDSGSRNVVVATVASADHVKMIDSSRRRPAAGVVAILAHIAGRHMTGALSASSDVIVATDAVAGNADVIESRRDPATGGVAIRTDIGTAKANIQAKFK